MSETGLIPCEEAVRQLWDYLDGPAVPADRTAVREHLAFCRRCCGELEFVKRLRTMLAAQATDEDSSPSIDRLERYLEGL